MTEPNKTELNLCTHRGSADFQAQPGFVWVVNFDTTGKDEVTISARLVKAPPES